MRETVKEQSIVQKVLSEDEMKSSDKVCNPNQEKETNTIKQILLYIQTLTKSRKDENIRFKKNS